MSRRPGGSLRRGWTTGACAAAAARAACQALLTGALPRSRRRSACRAASSRASRWRCKELTRECRPCRHRQGRRRRSRCDAWRAGRSPRWRAAAAGSGVTFRAGPGVGTVTRPGLPLAVGEPAINPGPRAMIAAALAEVAESSDTARARSRRHRRRSPAARNWRRRRSTPASASSAACRSSAPPASSSRIRAASWIHSIHRGIDVARAAGLTHVAARPARPPRRPCSASWACPRWRSSTWAISSAARSNICAAIRSSA